MPRADNLNGPYESHMSSKCGSLDVSQTYGPPRPVTGVVLLYGDGVCSCEVRTGL
jgi:hypothetical protein